MKLLHNIERSYRNWRLRRLNHTRDVVLYLCRHDHPCTFSDLWAWMQDLNSAIKHHEDKLKELDASP